MKIHEYQAKLILKDYGIKIQDGDVAFTPEQAVNIAQKFNRYPVVIKAQVHVGGRGKAGGVKLANDEKSVMEISSRIIGMNIKHTKVKKVLVSPAVDIKREMYVGLVVDRASKYPVLMVSPDGGVDIEETAEKSPEKILKVLIKPHFGIRPYQLRQISSFLKITKENKQSLIDTIKSLIKAFIDNDCSLAEINPLVISVSGEIIALDAKMNFDDNAVARHPDIAALRDDEEEDELEAEARRKKLNYVRLTGKIGCVVNGAGLAMATMDIVKYFGGEPANFLDIGGGSKADQVCEAIKLITKDPNVNTIFFNIFGGIVRCDAVAEGILTALKMLPDFKIPIVIRLSGTNEDIAHKMLKGTSLIVESTMSSAAKKAVEISLAAK